MSTYVSKYYSKTILETSNELEVHERIKVLLGTCLDSTGSFHDPDFGPKESDPKGECSIFYPPDEQVEVQGDAAVGAYNNIAGLGIDVIQWLRPKEFAQDPSKCNFITLSESESESEDEPESPQKNKLKKVYAEEIIKDKSRGASSLDVMQGNLGDCWFVSALTLVATRDDLFDNMICADRFDEYEKFGLYVFRMHRNCSVHYIIIDDKVPCIQRSSKHCIPAFARCRNPNEFWVSLVEKAYAKLSIRYINLTSGFIDEALEDLTGLSPEMIRFTSDINRESFWQTFKILTYTDSLVGASLNFLGRRDIPEEVKKELQTDAKHHGIQYGHAYGVLDIREIEDPSDPSEVYKLLRVKNPWGKENQMVWNGDWSDSDPVWTEEMKAKYNEAASQHPTKKDLEEMIYEWGNKENIFIISFDDFLTYFNTIMAVRDYPEEWSGTRYYTSWSPSYGIPPRGKTWYKNPQFPFYLKKETEISLEVQQPDPRSIAENRPPFKKFIILLVVFKLDASEKSIQEFDPKKIVLQSQGSDSRSVEVNGTLKPGKYCAILLNATENAVSEAYLSIYFSCPRDDILFENKNWEIIKEEEEEDKQRTEEIMKALGEDADPSLIKSAALPEIEKVEEEKKEDQEKVVAFGKTITKSINQSDSQKPPTYTQAIKDLKKNIAESVPFEDPESKIEDPLSLEIQFEIDLSTLLGIGYTDYRNFYEIPVEKQEKIIEQYSVDKNRTATVLDLNYYGLGNKGLMAVFSGIEDFPHLEYLYLKSNKLSDSIVCELCRRLELSRQVSVQEIDLSDNPDVGDTAGLALYTLCSNIKKLSKISLQGTGVSIKTVQKINSQLERNKKSN